MGVGRSLIEEPTKNEQKN